jgi:nitroreductase
MKMLKKLVTENRSCRRFFQDYVIGIDVLRELVDLARLSGSAGNMQSLRYILSCDPEKNDQIFQTLAWAAYLEDWPGPPEGERPSAYIVILDDKEATLSLGCDFGIAAQSMMLGAVEKGLRGCMIASIKREKLREVLRIPKRYDILLVLALGKPKEEVVIETIDPTDSVKYWRDNKGVHHVPKRALDDIIIG